MVKIICEGSDDKKLIISLIHLLIRDGKINQKYSNNITSYIQPMGSKSELLDHQYREYAIIKKAIENNKIHKLFFIFDCDFEKDDEKCGGMELSKKCFDNLIKNLKLPKNYDLDNYIFNTNLEHFLLKTIKENKCYNDFDNLVQCLELEKLKPNKKPIANLYNNLYPKSPYDFNHPDFDTLKEKLIKLFKIN